MKKLIHDIVTDIKFIYPCITHGEESIPGKELIIEAESSLSDLYPARKSVKGMETVGEDFWSRSLFKDDKEQYYCEVDGELYFKGSDPEGEPHCPVKKVIETNFPDIDKDLRGIDKHIEKVKRYFKIERPDLELVEVTKSLQENKDCPRQSKIVCSYRLSLRSRNLKEIKTALGTYETIGRLKTIIGVAVGDYEYALDGDVIVGYENYTTEELMGSHEYTSVVRVICADGWVEAQDTKNRVTTMIQGG